MAVPEGRSIEDIAATIGSYPEVTHNYERNHKFNLWFTLIAESEERIEKILSEISEKTGIQGIRNMPATKVFKITVFIGKIIPDHF